MTKEQQIYAAIKEAIGKAPEREKTAELHLQILKYATELRHVSREALSEELNIGASYKTEIGKMRNIIDRLIEAGLDPKKI